MSIPTAKRLLGRLSRSRKPKTQSQRTATTPTVSEPSKKITSKESPAPAKTPDLLDCPERVAEPLNRVLLVDKNSYLAKFDIGATYPIWIQMNLIVVLDYATNSFEVLKNRWGAFDVKGIPLDLLATFLYHPEVTDARELNMLRIDHNNLFATRKPEQ